jgi:hypothetical protein
METRKRKSQPITYRRWLVILSVSIAWAQTREGQTLPHPDKRVTRQEIESSISRVETLTKEIRRLNQTYWKQMKALRQTWDSGYTNRDGKRIPSADARVVWEDPGKNMQTMLFAARTAASACLYDPNPLLTLAELRKRIGEVEDAITQAWYVKARAGTVAWGDPEALSSKEYRSQTQRIKRAALAAEAEKRLAVQMLPPDLPRGRRTIVGVLRNGFNVEFNLLGMHIGSPLGNAQAVTLLTYGGRIPRTQRQLFYEEGIFMRSPKGSQRQVYWTRKRVVVDLATGYHFLQKEYDLRVYDGVTIPRAEPKTASQDDFWPLEPPEDSTEPTIKEVADMLPSEWREPLYAARVLSPPGAGPRK